MFKHIKKTIDSLLKDEEGQGMVEYIIIVVVIAIAAIVVFKTIGKNIRKQGQTTADEIEKLGDTLR